jgi:hypothetical protein
MELDGPIAAMRWFEMSNVISECGGAPVASMMLTCEIARTHFAEEEQDGTKPQAADSDRTVTASSLFTKSASLFQTVVFFQDGAELVVGQRDDFVIIDADHRFGSDHGVDDSFFGGLDGSGEDWFDLVIR